MTEENQPKELRIKGSSAMLEYIRRFSSTEKIVFGIFVLAVLVTAVIMVGRVNGYFMVEVPAHGGELREGLVGLPRTINPILAVTDTDKDLDSLVYSGLMKYDGDSLVPDIAQSYSVSTDTLTYDFILRSDVRFQDGTPLTADDVAFTIAKIQDPALKSPRGGDWNGVTVNVISPTEIQFTLKQPYSPFLDNATIGIVPKHVWNNVSDDQFIFSAYNTQPIGSGPYKVSSITRDSGGIPTAYDLETWSGYYGDTPYLRTISFDFFPGLDKALDALNSGTIDSASSLDPDSAAEIAGDSAEPYTVISSPLSQVFGVFFNQNQNPALADNAVRQALDMAAPRTTIIETVLHGYGVPLHGPLPPGVESGASTSTSAATNTADIAGAQMVLQKDGWVKGADGIYAKKSGKISIPLSFDLYTADIGELKETADLLQTSWTALGADVNIKIFEPNDLYENVIRTRSYDALLFGEQIGKDGDLYAFWDSSERTAPGLNVAMYTNSKADALLSDYRATSDPTKQTADIASFEAMLANDRPAVFLYSPDFIYAVPKSLHGITLSSLSSPADRFDSIDSWYIETERVWKIFASGN